MNRTNIRTSVEELGKTREKLQALSIETRQSRKKEKTGGRKGKLQETGAKGKKDGKKDNLEKETPSRRNEITDVLNHQQRLDVPITDKIELTTPFRFHCLRPRHPQPFRGLVPVSYNFYEFVGLSTTFSVIFPQPEESPKSTALPTTCKSKKQSPSSPINLTPSLLPSIITF